jgi:hypothetical protein
MKRCVLLVAVLCCGCLDSLEKQAQKDPKKGIVGKTTQDIGKFDPNAGKVVGDQKIHATDPISAPVQVYGPLTERLALSQTEHAIRLFQATEDRYPKDYEEFMEKIVKANNIRLPTLHPGAKYQYDEANHQLVVVKE